MPKPQVVVTDFIEPDLQWEEEQLAQLGVDFDYHQLKYAPAEQIVQAAGGTDVLVVNMARIDRQVIEGLRRCRLIIRHGVGYDNVDLQAADEHGILVCNIPDYCINEVAEQAVMLIFACQRKLTTQIEILQASSQAGTFLFDSIHPVYSVRGKTVGLIGCGRIGSTVYNMLQGFQTSFLICDPYLSERRRRKLGIQTVPLEHLLEQADIVTVHVPLNPETHHLLDAHQFERMKTHAILVNTSRGGTVNLLALDRALREGQLAMAGIDVFEHEPPTPDHPLLHNPRAVCTPHLAWLSEEASWSIREKILEDVRRFLQGEPPRFPVNQPAKLRVGPAG